jgi:predicted SnoaL-like aldol condensation-catalyzing enzyme
MKTTVAAKSLIATLLLIVVSPVIAQMDAMNAQERANLQMVRDWWRECIEARHLDRTSMYMSDDYIQHNINVPTGRAGFEAFFTRLGPPVNPMPQQLSAEPVVQFAKGDFVLLVWEREAQDPADESQTYKYNSYDLMRIENGKIQEHWDYALRMSGAPRGGGPNGTDFSAFEFDYSDEELEAIRIANIEFKDILQYGHVELAEEVMAPDYIQHNPNVPTGRDGFVQFFSRFANPEPIQDEWKNEPDLILASGPYVFYMFERSIPDPDYPQSTYPGFWFDMVRVEDGLIQEHWDSAMKNPPQ